MSLVALAAESRQGLLRRLFLQVVDDDPCPFIGELGRDGAADSSAGSRDDRYFCVELAHADSRPVYDATFRGR